MNIDCEHLGKLIASNFSLVVECDSLDNGVLRIATPFRYPDGSFVDIFISQNAGLILDDQSLFKGFILSDFGRTAMFLRNMNVFLRTKKRKQIVGDVCDVLGVDALKSELMVRLEDHDSALIPDAIFRLAQACIRVGDLSYSQRFAASTPFKEEVEEFLESSSVEYEPDITISGQFGSREVPIDFKVIGRLSKPTLVKTLSAGNSATAHSQMLEVTSCWMDLQHVSEQNQFVTLIDDRSGAYRDPDIERLKSLAPILGFPSQVDQIRHVLAA